jgi:dethiobiotin synthetase
MHKAIFITGTDTGVGKTYIACCLLKAFKTLGLKVCPMKLVETGCMIRKKKILPRDARKLMHAAGIQEKLDTINPYRFRMPLAPAVAAAFEKRVIDKKKIFDCYGYLVKKYELTIIEGAGGIMVPLSQKYLFSDFIQDINIPIIIVSRPGLGTINHTLLSVEAAKNRGINILGVIMNYTKERRKGIAEKTNPSIIEHLSRVPVLEVVPYRKTVSLKDIKKDFISLAQKILHEL